MTLKQWARGQAYACAISLDWRGVLYWLGVMAHGWAEGSDETPVLFWQEHEA